ncbi:Fucose permease [Anaerocolumna jejuensis DSM 15929]|uniref:Fucose permease n=1 Tax=Anaerocolumna jejuensis DSM 15929 TaxID=1121322 RepID=A0A1M6WC27_9FIRM|nr:MFS transporter [Anaerocolumna jejuensis]SHK91035.1 Fucose permease [Anaerocolumna jejuensis DSM 15929]
MATLLLIIIYIAFIGLGIPDSLFGTAWPAIYTEFGLPIASASYVTLLISGGTVISSLLSAKIISRFSTGKVTAVSTFLTAAALFGFSCSGNMIWLCLFAIPLGLGAGAIDTALNNYVALHYKAMHMNFLHCFYGIGVSLSPYLMSVSLMGKAGWRGGYRTVFYFQLTIAFIMILALPLWNKVKDAVSAEEQETHSSIGILQLLKMPSVRITGLIFIGSCAIEYTCGIWGSTFLVNTKGVATEFAARMITFYYFGMALGRFLSGILSNKLSGWKLIKIGQSITLTAILILFLPLPSFISGVGLFMVGLGNGPIYPNLIHLTPQNFGKELSQSVMGVQMAASYIGIMLMPPLFGMLAQNISVRLFPYYLLILFGIMVGATYLLVRMLKKQ